MANGPGFEHQSADGFGRHPIPSRQPLCDRGLWTRQGLGVSRRGSIDSARFGFGCRVISRFARFLASQQPFESVVFGQRADFLSASREQHRTHHAQSDQRQRVVADIQQACAHIAQKHPHRVSATSDCSAQFCYRGHFKPLLVLATSVSGDAGKACEHEADNGSDITDFGSGNEDGAG